MNRPIHDGWRELVHSYQAVAVNSTIDPDNANSTEAP